MKDIIKDIISSDSQILGLHKTIRKIKTKAPDFSMLLSIYIADYLKETIESAYRGPFQSKTSSEYDQAIYIH